MFENAIERPQGAAGSPSEAQLLPTQPETRLKALEGSLSALETGLGLLSAEAEVGAHRVDDLRTTVGQMKKDAEHLRLEMRAFFSTLTQDHQRLEGEMRALAGQVREINRVISGRGPIS